MFLKVLFYLYLKYINILLKHCFSSSGTASIEKPYLNSLLGKHLANNLCQTISKCDVFKNSEFDMDKILQVGTNFL